MMRAWRTHPPMRGLDVDDPRCVPIRPRILRERVFSVMSVEDTDPQSPFDAVVGSSVLRHLDPDTT
jgi:hypothetical protein